MGAFFKGVKKMLIKFTTIPVTKLFNKIDNSLQFTDIDFTVKNFSDTNIIITISPDTSEFENFEQYNYCYIPKLKRYYHVSWIGLQNGLYIYSLDCDYIQTFCKTILNDFVIISGLTLANSMNVVKLNTIIGQWLVPDKFVFDMLEYTPQESEPLLRKKDFENIITELNKYIFINDVDSDND